MYFKKYLFLVTLLMLYQFCIFNLCIKLDNKHICYYTNILRKLIFHCHLFNSKHPQSQIFKTYKYSNTNVKVWYTILNFWLTLRNVWSNSWFVVARTLGSWTKHIEEKCLPSSLKLSGISGISPIPTLNIIW